MFNPEPPQGFTPEQQQSIITRSPVPLFAPPQGFGKGETIPPDIPSAPLNLIALAISSTEIDLDWNIPTSEGSSPITGYQIERQKEAGGFIIIVFNTGNTDVTFNDSGLENNTNYSYRVAAINSSGVGLVSNTNSATTFTIPDAPTSLAAMTISPTEIDLDWTAPVFVGNTPIIGYQIERQKGAGAFVIIVADTGNTNVFFNDTSLDSDTLYSYRVAAINSVGVGPVSNIDSATTLPPVPVSMTYEDGVIMAYEPTISEWFNPSWQKQLELTINSGQVPSTQNNFPLLINDTYSDLIGQTEAQLRFTDENNIQLEYEIQEFDTVTGKLIAWIKKPTVSDGDIIRIYFDNVTAVDEQNPNAVYDSDYTSVYHLNGIGTDSTVNGENLTLNNNASVLGKIGDGIDFEGNVNSFAVRNPYTIFPLDAITCEIWVKTITSGEGIVSYAVGVAGLANHFLIFRQDNISTFILNDSTAYNEDISDGSFHHVVATWRSSDGQLRLYVDGILIQTDFVQIGNSFTNNGCFVLGQEQDDILDFAGTQAFEGTLDEVKMSKISRSTDYVTTTFNNQNNPGAFYATGAVVDLSSILVAMEYEL